MGTPESSTRTGSLREARQFEMDTLVGVILQDGVLLSLGLIITGLFWRWHRTGGVALDYQIAGTNLFEFVTGEIRLAVHGTVRPRLLVNLGIAVLMLTPFIRVAASVVYFMGVLRNWKYTFFTAVVLIVLTYSLFLR
ncbi:MAG: DUF1634 domain-containing protein [Acidobacteria bacterium]|nr:MAG: DUF1634 domain-containing protein [Acidobacteriota bacterium]